MVERFGREWPQDGRGGGHDAPLVVDGCIHYAAEGLAWWDSVGGDVAEGFDLEDLPWFSVLAGEVGWRLVERIVLDRDGHVVGSLQQCLVGECAVHDAC